MKKIFNSDETFLARWLNNELSDEELATFKASEEYAEFERVVSSLDEVDTPVWNEEGVLKNVLSESKNQSVPKRRTLIRFIPAVAAVGILLIGALFVLNVFNDSVVYQTQSAERTEVKLPDGSIVYLNADSRIEYKKGSFNSKRDLQLTGEAFFEVEEGKPFSVTTSEGVVKVLGTSFNVFARANKFNVECYSGKVGVSTSEQRTEELTAGMSVAIENKQVKRRYVVGSGTELPYWRQGKSRFSNAAFSDVVSELERQFNIVIDVPQDLAQLEGYNGGFDHDDLTEALTIVSTSINCSYNIDGDVVQLIKN